MPNQKWCFRKSNKAMPCLIPISICPFVLIMALWKKYTGLFIKNLTLSKFYWKKTDDAVGTCSVSSDVETSAPRSEGGAGKDHECSRIDLYERPGESVWWTRIQNWRVHSHTRCSHWEFVGLKQTFESFCTQWYAVCLNCIISILEIKFWKC
jgi:hypothetical protein